MIATLLSLCLAIDDVPPTPKQAVTDEYHGVKVADQYRWLEPAASPECASGARSRTRRMPMYLVSYLINSE